MARPLRIEYPGAFVHVMSGAMKRRISCKTARDREKFLSYLLAGLGEVWGGVPCLLPREQPLPPDGQNPPAGILSRVMKHISGSYTTYFNLKHQRAGHLLQGRYKATSVRPAPTLLNFRAFT